MNRMSRTRIEDLGEHGAGQRLQQLVGDAERERRHERAPQIADAAEHHDHEAVDDVALAEVRRDVVDLRERDARDTGDAAAEAERQGIDAAGANAHRAGHAAVLRHGAHLQAERRQPS